MESSHLTTAEDNLDNDEVIEETSDTTSSSRKRARLLAKAAVRSNNEPARAHEDDQPVKHESLWEVKEPHNETLAESIDPERLSDDEEQFAEQKIAIAHNDIESASPQPPEGTPEGRAVEARRTFRHKIIHEGKNSTEALDETLEEYDLVLPEITDNEDGHSPDASTEVRTEVEEDDGDEADDTTAVTHSGVTTTPSPITPAGTPPGGGSPRAAHTGGHGSGGGAPPSGTPPSPPSGSGGHSFGAGPVYIPPGIAGPVAPRPAAVETADEYHIPHPATSALIGGIIGYFIGRRRGRIRTEKKLLPIQKKLEKQVKSLEFDISQKEDKISRAVREQTTAERALASAQRDTEQSAMHSSERMTPKQQPAKTMEQLAKATLSEAAPRLKERRTAAPEAHQLHGTKSTTESIGKVLVQAESVPVLEAAIEATTRMSDTRERSRPPEALKPVVVSAAPERRTETMSHAELLDLSDKININGSTLRQIYETRLVGEKGLRRLVNEHLHGGDVKRALRQEITERQVDFERDPVMRDHGSQSAAAGGSTTKLQDFLQRADETSFENKEEAAFFKARVEHESREKAKQKRQRRLLDVSMVTSILVLAVLVALLLMK